MMQGSGSNIFLISTGTRIFNICYLFMPAFLLAMAMMMSWRCRRQLLLSLKYIFIYILLLLRFFTIAQGVAGVQDD